MLQVPFIRENRERLIEGLKKRVTFNDFHLIDEVIGLDDKRKSIQQEMDSLNAQSNDLSKQIGGLFKAGKVEEAQEVKKQTQEISARIKALKPESIEVSEKLVGALRQLPNLPQEIVPLGKDDSENVMIKEGGVVPSLKVAEPHWEIAEKFKLIDFQLGAKVTGAGFPFYLGKGARLQRALINYFLDFNRDAGYSEVIPPFVINEASGYGTGQLPDKEGQMYHNEKDDLYLIPTSEVPVTNMYRDVLLQEKELPVKMTAYSPCFRREAGSYGAHVRGLNRLHQFEKVEIVQITKPSESEKALKEMVAHVEKLVNNLGLPYRIVRLCGGDLGFTSAITYDFEIYSTAQERWLEVSSVSNFEAYQANRLKCRYKNKETKKNELCHTLNGSSLALPRILATILENYQTPEGVKIPEVLIPYCGFDIISE
ncbi:MAG: serine--tRNA ligase [Flavobacteriales bacterium]|nr:serine--tRNA ligase [Flavobacteriales bacterium]